MQTTPISLRTAAEYLQIPERELALILDVAKKGSSYTTTESWPIPIQTFLELLDVVDSAELFAATFSNLRFASKEGFRTNLRESLVRMLTKLREEDEAEQTQKSNQ